MEDNDQSYPHRNTISRATTQSVVDLQVSGLTTKSGAKRHSLDSTPDWSTSLYPLFFSSETNIERLSQRAIRNNMQQYKVNRYSWSLSVPTISLAIPGNRYNSSKQETHSMETGSRSSRWAQLETASKRRSKVNSSSNNKAAW